MIYRAIEEGLDIDDLDERLFNSGLNILTRERNRGLGNYAIVNQTCHIEQIGEDSHSGFVEMRLRSDSGEMRYLLILSETLLQEDLISPENPDAFYFVLDRSLYPCLKLGDCARPLYKVIECYEDYEVADGSEFFPYFRKLERFFFEELKKHQKEEDDTAYSPTEHLCVGKFQGTAGVQVMCEVYMFVNGMYVPVVRDGDKYSFSSTEESYLRLWIYGSDFFSAVKTYPARIHFLENNLTEEQAQKSPYWDYYQLAKLRIPEYLQQLRSNSL